MRGRRFLLGVVVPAAVVAVCVVSVALSGDDLPDRVASHFDMSGTPDSSMPPFVLFTVIALTLIVPGLGECSSVSVRSWRS